MKLGFCSAILPELSLEEVIQFASAEGFSCVELMCRPNWGRFFSVLSDTGYDGPVCIEVEDRAFEGTTELHKSALRQAAAFLRQFNCLGTSHTPVSCVGIYRGKS